MLTQVQTVGLQEKNLRGMMRKQNMTAKQIAKYLGISMTTVISRIREYKINRKKS